MALPEIIDNQTQTFGDDLRKITLNYNNLSTVTGYWGLNVFSEHVGQIKNYDSINLIIDKDSIPPGNINSLNTARNEFGSTFPDSDKKHYSNTFSCWSYIYKHRGCAKTVRRMIGNRQHKSKVFNRQFMHSSKFLFGDLKTENSLVFYPNQRKVANSLDILSITEKPKEKDEFYVIP
jgi:hypothetical protein